jgi:NAD(P)-dependent dehydrogenase (short-subunit alcohol dehydrogenase family)
MNVAGKKAVVFGGTSGIGLAAAKQLMALGAKVIAVSRNPDKAAGVSEGITFKQCDVLDREGVQALLAECAPHDILVSAATGGARAIGPFLEMDMDGYKGSFDFYSKATADNIIPRAGTADEIAMGIVFLIQNDFVTGTTVDIDGGWLLS